MYTFRSGKIKNNKDDKVPIPLFNSSVILQLSSFFTVHLFAFKMNWGYKAGGIP